MARGIISILCLTLVGLGAAQPSSGPSTICSKFLTQDTCPKGLCSWTVVRGQGRCTCGIMAGNFMYAVDSSGSIGSRRFTEQKKFLLGLTKTMGPRSNVGIVQFWSRVRTILAMKNVKGGQSPNPISTVERAVRGLRWTRGRTYMGGAILNAENALINKAVGKKFILLITDGKPNGPINVCRRDLVRKMRGIQLVVIAVGGGIRRQTFDCYRNNLPRPIIVKTDWNRLMNVLPLIETYLCPRSCLPVLQFARRIIQDTTPTPELGKCQDSNNAQHECEFEPGRPAKGCINRGPTDATTATQTITIDVTGMKMRYFGTYFGFCGGCGNVAANAGGTMKVVITLDNSGSTRIEMPPQTFDSTPTNEKGGHWSYESNTDYIKTLQLIIEPFDGKDASMLTWLSPQLCSDSTDYSPTPVVFVKSPILPQAKCGYLWCTDDGKCTVAQPFFTVFNQVRSLNDPKDETVFSYSLGTDPNDFLYADPRRSSPCSQQFPMLVSHVRSDVTFFQRSTAKLGDWKRTESCGRFTGEFSSYVFSPGQDNPVVMVQIAGGTGVQNADLRECDLNTRRQCGWRVVKAPPYAKALKLPSDFTPCSECWKRQMSQRRVVEGDGKVLVGAMSAVEWSWMGVMSMIFCVVVLVAGGWMLIRRVCSAEKILIGGDEYVWIEEQ